MSEKIEQLADKLGELDHAAAGELAVGFMRALGLSMPVRVQAPIGEPEPLPAPEQTEFDVVYHSFDGDKKVAVVKALRAVAGLGLKEAMDYAMSGPHVVKAGVSKDVAQTIYADLTNVGAKMEIK